MSGRGALYKVVRFSVSSEFNCSFGKGLLPMMTLMQKKQDVSHLCLVKFRSGPRGFGCIEKLLELALRCRTV